MPHKETPREDVRGESQVNYSNRKGADSRPILPDTADVPVKQRRRELPTARATAYEPSGDRTRLLAVVERCPHCHGSHQHYGTDLGSLLDAVRAGCGRRYRLRLVRLVGVTA